MTQRPRNSRNSVLQKVTSFWITINHTIPTKQTWIRGPTKHFLSEITKLQNHEIKIKHIPEKFSQNHKITKSRNQDPFNFIPTNPFQFSHHNYLLKIIPFFLFFTFFLMTWSCVWFRLQNQLIYGFFFYARRLNLSFSSLQLKKTQFTKTIIQRCWNN